MSHILGFTGDRDVGQEGIELAQQEWLGGRPGSRRVIINRRGDAVEDVESIRAPQAGRDLALAIDTRLQHIARSWRSRTGRRTTRTRATASRATRCAIAR